MKRPIDERAMEEAYGVLWRERDAEPVSAEDLLEATERMFGVGSSRADPTSDGVEVDDWAATLFS